MPDANLHDLDAAAVNAPALDARGNDLADDHDRHGDADAHADPNTDAEPNGYPNKLGNAYRHLHALADGSAVVNCYCNGDTEHAARPPTPA
jgi:hypothetical protein